MIRRRATNPGDEELRRLERAYEQDASVAPALLREIARRDGLSWPLFEHFARDVESVPGLDRRQLATFLRAVATGQVVTRGRYTLRPRQTPSGSLPDEPGVLLMGEIEGEQAELVDHGTHLVAGTQGRSVEGDRPWRVFAHVGTYSSEDPASWGRFVGSPFLAVHIGQAPSFRGGWGLGARGRGARQVFVTSLPFDSFLDPATTRQITAPASLVILWADSALAQTRESPAAVRRRRIRALEERALSLGFPLRIRTRRNAHGEYVVVFGARRRHPISGEYEPVTESFHDDLDDAIATAEAELNRVAGLPPQQNPDDRLRDLERQLDAGDPTRSATYRDELFRKGGWGLQPGRRAWWLSETHGPRRVRIVGQGTWRGWLTVEDETTSEQFQVGTHAVLPRHGNPGDEDLRRLERLAETGDPEARERLRRVRSRTSYEAALEEQAQALDERLRRELQQPLEPGRRPLTAAEALPLVEGLAGALQRSTYVAGQSGYSYDQRQLEWRRPVYGLIYSTRDETGITIWNPFLRGGPVWLPRSPEELEIRVPTDVAEVWARRVNSAAWQRRVQADQQQNLGGA